MTPSTRVLCAARLWAHSWAVLVGLALSSCVASTSSTPIAANLADVPAPPRCWQLTVAPQVASWAAIADDGAGWRELRERLGPAAADLPALPCAFAVECVLVVATAAAPIEGPLVWRRTNEEDVEVWTFRASAAVDRAPRSLAVAVVLPKAGPSRAIVLALPDERYGLAVESTLLVTERD
jgi:hypothetical protein